MVYTWKTGSRINADANIAGKQCEELSSQGKLTAKNLLDLNRPVNAPLHGCFNWNDKEAAEMYREQQARHIINCIVTASEDGTVSERVFFNVEVTESTYEHIDVILQSEDKTSKLLKQARKEMDIFKAKYRHLSQLTKVIKAIDEFETEQLMIS